MKKWKILEQKDISPSKWFPLLCDKVELGNGTVVEDYYVSPMGKVAMVVAVTKEKEIVLVKQYKHGVQDFLIELPAGFKKEDQTIEQAAVCELEEETGIKIDETQLIPMGKVANLPSKADCITHGFLAQDVEFNSKQQLDPTEEIEVLTVPVKQVIEMMQSGEIIVGDSVYFLMMVYLKHPEIFGKDNS